MLANIQTLVYDIRGTKVMLDSDLAKLYEVETKRINEAVKRNPNRFPFDMMFEMTKDEVLFLRSQNATFNKNTKLRKYTPKVFTEQGVYMLATVLKSKVAIEVTLSIMRTFTKMREFALGYKDVVQKLQDIEKTIRIDQQQLNYNTEKIDEAFVLLKEILNDTTKTSTNKIGFRIDD